MDRDNRSTDTQLASLWSKAAIVLYWAVIFLTITWAIVTRDPSFKTIVFLLFIGLLAGALPLERYAGNLRVRGFALQANHDALTGLSNRRIFTSQLASMLRKRRPRGLALAVLILDLDRFKTINDTLGHAAGDQLLKLVADRLRKFEAPGAVVARLGGDEFGILLEVDGKEDLISFADEVVGAINFRTSVASQPIWVNGSVGAALAPIPLPTTEEIMSMADVALYQAKGAGRNQARVFDPHRPLPSVSQLSKDYELRMAIERGQLLLHYQPVMDLRTGKLDGFEALVRWNHPKLGFIRPDTFIPMAEDNGLIMEMGKWILGQSCQQASIWSQLFGAGISISINVSAVQFIRSDVVLEVGAAIKASGIDPASVHIEITETAFAEDEELTLEHILGLQALGVQISIDDFGVGYSSLNYLRKFPADYLKIDKSFVEEIEDIRAFGVIKGAIEMGHALGMKVIAEGVEQPQQLELLREAGCDLAQGYLFYKPLEIASATALLINGQYPASAETPVVAA